MSTSYAADGEIRISDLRGFDRNGVRAHRDSEGLALTDGRNWMRVYPGTRTQPLVFERCGDNDPRKIVAEIEAAFGVALVSEYEPGYGKLWGTRQ